MVRVLRRTEHTAASHSYIDIVGLVAYVVHSEFWGHSERHGIFEWTSGHAQGGKAATMCETGVALQSHLRNKVVILGYACMPNFTQI